MLLQPPTQAAVLVSNAEITSLWASAGFWHKIQRRSALGTPIANLAVKAACRGRLIRDFNYYLDSILSLNQGHSVKRNGVLNQVFAECKQLAFAFFHINSGQFCTLTFPILTDKP